MGYLDGTTHHRRIHISSTDFNATSSFFVPPLSGSRTHGCRGHTGAPMRIFGSFDRRMARKVAV